MSALLLRWRFFWSKRSRRRSTAALGIALLALLATIYLALPPAEQQLITSGFTTIIQSISAFGLQRTLGAGIAICLVVCLVLIFVPTYRRHSYLPTARSLIPSVSVYLDAENQLPEAAIGSFSTFLMKYLDGRRADLLYFLDASQTANGAKYKQLYRFGFRPVDVPHNPTGEGDVKEAVDRELSMHAYERALLGPEKQEFIIITGDGDYVPLVYRLAALGHRVQIWAMPIRPAYRALATYLDIDVLDLSLVVSELQVTSPKPESVPSEGASPQSSSAPNASPQKSVAPKTRSRSKRRNRSKYPRTPRFKYEALPMLFSSPRQQQMYQAIAGTVETHTQCKAVSHSDKERAEKFKSVVNGLMRPRLANVGYNVGNQFDYWLDALAALHVFEFVKGASFPQRGPTTIEDATRSMYAMVEAAAQATLQTPTNMDGAVRMSAIATALRGDPDTNADANLTTPLRQMLKASGSKAIPHTRYFVRSARALGLLTFDDLPNTLDTIRNPRLIEESPVLSTPARQADLAPAPPENSANIPQSDARIVPTPEASSDLPDISAMPMPQVATEVFSHEIVSEPQADI